MNSSLIPLGQPSQATAARLRAARVCVLWLCKEQKWREGKKKKKKEGRHRWGQSQWVKSHLFHFFSALADLTVLLPANPIPSLQNSVKTPNRLNWSEFLSTCCLSLGSVRCLYMVRGPSRIRRPTIWRLALTPALTINYLTSQMRIMIATSKSYGKNKKSQRFYTRVSSITSNLTAAGGKNRLLIGNFSNNKESEI